MFLQVLLIIGIHAVSVLAQSCKYGELMLSDDGTVNVCMNSNWNAVCYSSDKSQELTARVICRELGFSPQGFEVDKVLIQLRSPTYQCNGTESSLIFCDRYYNYWCRQQLQLRCMVLQNETIPEIVHISDAQTTVSLKWTLLKANVTGYFIECSSIDQASNLMVNNKTSVTKIRGLLPLSNYTCCVSAVFTSHSTKSCASIGTGVTDQSTAAGINTNAVGGVLGVIVAILTLLLLLAILAFLYPCLIRPRVQRSKILSRLSHALDQRVYNNIYKAYTENTITSNSINTHSKANSVPAAASVIDSARSTSAQDYETPQSNCTALQRSYESAGYAVPNDCLVSKDTDHVYAVLEEPNE